MFLMTAIVLTLCVSVMSAQTPTGISEQQVKDLLNRIDKNTDRFAKSADSALDKSGYDGTAKEDELNSYLKNFRQSTEGLRTNIKTISLADTRRTCCAVEWLSIAS